jgi:hypothetical protein
LTESQADHPGRNDPCHCGSGKKYKRCCLAKDQTAEREARTDAATEAAPPPSEEQTAEDAAAAKRSEGQPWQRKNRKHQPF